MATRDVIVVGASMGGVEALSRLASSLPPDLPAAVLVVLHTPPDAPSLLAELLRARGRLPADDAVDGDRVEPGRIYVAPPNRHLLLDGDRIALSVGARENRHRPAIDPLFRSAAETRGEGVVGVVLSGALDDGTDGLAAILRSGGVTVVQDPSEAANPSMPRSAVEHVDVHFVVGLEAMSPLLVRLANGEAVPARPRVEEHPENARPSAFSCPDCGGVLWELTEGRLTRYACKVGHRFSPLSLDDGQSDTIEGALWAALRAIDDRVRLLDRIAADARTEEMKRYFRDQLAQARAHAGALGELIRARRGARSSEPTDTNEEPS